MRAEIEAKFNEAATPVVKHLIECRHADVDKEEAHRQASEMLVDLLWAKLANEEREELFCDLCALMLLNVAVKRDDAEKSEATGHADIPPEIADLIAKIKESVAARGESMIIEIKQMK